MKFNPNSNGSIEFTVQQDVCIGQIIESQINADLSGANARGAYDEMVAAKCRINVLDFSRVTHVNSGAWNRFSALARELYLRGHRLRFVGLSGHALRTYHLNKLDNRFPRYENIEDAIQGMQALNPETDKLQSADIAWVMDRNEGKQNQMKDSG